jgi:RHS repeat-associated protein
VTYGYDSSTGRLTSVASPSGTVSYGYDGSGMQRLNQVSGPQGSTQVGWYPGGELATLTTGSYQELRCYDGAGRIAEVQNGTGWLSCGSRSSGVVAGYVYGYDGRGNRTSEEYFTGTGGSESTTYGYDSADRLTGVQYGSLAVLYGLAGDGTRLGEKRVPAYAGTLGAGSYEGAGGASEALAYAFDGQGGLQTVTDTVVQQPVASYTVDASGRVLTETRPGLTRSYKWDAASRLREATVASGTVAYGYDFRGLRTSKSGPSGTTSYLWGGSELVEEGLPSGTVVYARMGSLAIAAGINALMHDGLGSVVGPVGGEPYRYDAWGGFRGASPGASEPSLAYAGQHWDADVGLSYAQQRWYDAGTGRFLSEDPVFGDPRVPVTLFTFGYANGNPTGFVDPDGRFACWIVPGLCDPVNLAQGYMAVRSVLGEENQKRLDKYAGKAIQGLIAAKANLGAAQQVTDKVIDEVAYLHAGGNTLGDLQASGESAVASNERSVASRALAALFILSFLVLRRFIVCLLLLPSHRAAADRPQLLATAGEDQRRGATARGGAEKQVPRLFVRRLDDSTCEQHGPVEDRLHIRRMESVFRLASTT